MSTFLLQIVTPDGQFFNGPAERIIVRAMDGEVCILPRHTKYVTALSIGEARVTMDGKVHRAACSNGMLSVLSDKVRVVAGTFEWEEDIDAERALQAKERAEQTLRDAKDDEQISIAKAKLSRALVRINVAK